MNFWHILKKYLKEEEIVKDSNRWNSLSSKPHIKKINELHNIKREERKEEAPVASTSKPTSPRREEEQEKELEETIFSRLQDTKNPKIFHGQCLKHIQNPDEIQG
ncbi:hypothetical protein O181_056543 [Austropuccinia psidii MF-1]|uniref:Uncharacterized protein n=1 Tax=Austropuccinia psidii MF-1 TaxID=1389203 RepID=A0A9Q3E9S4_9BASI|nr:hypothetical protein [Austropuccinia psidii MF-1]